MGEKLIISDLYDKYKKYMILPYNIYLIITNYKYPENDNFLITEPWRDKVNDRGGHGRTLGNNPKK
jgi:hypothetical protein